MQSIGKINAITKIFNDAYKSKDSLIIIDSIERLVEFVKVGSNVNYSNAMIQNLLTLLLKKPTNPECKLLVVGTTSSYSALELFNFDKVFGLKMKIPLLERKECA